MDNESDMLIEDSENQSGTNTDLDSLESEDGQIEESKVEIDNRNTPTKALLPVESNRRKSAKCLIITSFSIILPAILIVYVLNNINNLQRLEPVKYNDVLLNADAYKWYNMENFFKTETINMFKNLVLNGEYLTTIVDDKAVESAGEAVEVGHPNCKHPFMTLNLNRSICHFSNRLDVGMHFVKTGGFNGHIEYYERMVARIIPFRKRLIIQQSQTPNSVYSSFINLKNLEEFNTVDFKEKMNAICADNTIFHTKNVNKNAIVSEMFQLDLLLILPGQELPMHLNVPYFWSADRNNLPQWLLVLMKRSRLFNNIFIPQVQGINWINFDESFKPVESEFVDLNGDGGDFYFYPYLPLSSKRADGSTEYSKENISKYVILKSVPNSAIMLDGAQIIHGVDRYKPNELPPLFGHNHHYRINFDKSADRWYLYDSQNSYLKSYYKADVKILVVWNAHCFADEAERENFHNFANRQDLSLSSIIEVFKNDLRKRNRLPSENIEPLELWTVALKEYLKYPINRHQQNSTIFGINYCLLPNLVPRWFTNAVLKPYLSKRC